MLHCLKKVAKLAQAAYSMLVNLEAKQHLCTCSTKKKVLACAVKRLSTAQRSSAHAKQACCLVKPGSIKHV
jgi:hypothetical protein